MIFHASPAGYDGGMDENPYTSPEAASKNQSADRRQTRPSWQGGIAPVLIVLGVLRLLVLLGDVLIPGRPGFVSLSTGNFGAALVLGVGLIVAGLIMRRKNS
jgi:hypothetical protein